MFPGNLDPRAIIGRVMDTADELLNKAGKAVSNFKSANDSNVQLRQEREDNGSETLFIEIALPGYAKDAIDSRVDGSTLIITARGGSKHPSKPKCFAVSDFYKELVLPRGAELDRIGMVFQSGLLVVEVPIGEVPQVKVSVV